MTGRRRDLIITAASTSSPTRWRFLAEHPAVAEVAVGGLPDPGLGRAGGAWAVPADPDAPPTVEELRAFARARLTAAKLPRQLVVVDGLPRNASGKLVSGS